MKDYKPYVKRVSVCVRNGLDGLDSISYEFDIPPYLRENAYEYLKEFALDAGKATALAVFQSLVERSIMDRNSLAPSLSLVRKIPIEAPVLPIETIVEMALWEVYTVGADPKERNRLRNRIVNYLLAYARSLKDGKPAFEPEPEKPESKIKIRVFDIT